MYASARSFSSFLFNPLPYFRVILADQYVRLVTPYQHSDGAPCITADMELVLQLNLDVRRRFDLAILAHSPVISERKVVYVLDFEHPWRIIPRH